MCGIVGILNFTEERIDRDLLDRMRDVIAHRGPDGAQSWVAPDGRIGLGHRRLKIIDLSETAAQPMANEDGTVRVSFNGEIYNHVEIRRELEAIGGHAWRTDHSDTEVIVHAYEQWGIGCLERFRGMFAISLWDARERRLWLVRDRLGVKPLYYAKHDDRLVFASEIKALLEDPRQPRAVDEEAFHHYLSFLAAPAPRTLFAGICKLPAGTWLRIDVDGRVAEHRYWDAIEAAGRRGPLADDEDALGAALMRELRDAVRLRARSDVPVGIFLSGGIDSSTNAALFAECGGGGVRTFSIGYGDDTGYADELPFARRMAAHVGADHHELRLKEDDLLDFLPKMIWLQDEPIADPVCVPVYYVSKLAREHGVTVCQVGEGADELFWGYPAWKTMRRLQMLADTPGTGLAQWAARVALRGAGRQSGFRAEWLRRARNGQPIFWGGAEAFTEAQKQALLAPRLRRALDGLTSWDAIAPIHARYRANAWSRDPLSWMTYLDLNLRLPELLLMRVDKMSMGVSLEGRVPFLDQEVVTLALRMPDAVKTRNGTLKYIVKKSVRGLIPDAIIDRPKQGFGVPIHDWFLRRLGDEARRELEAFCAGTDLLDGAAVRRLLDTPGRGEQVWYLLNFALWWRKFISP